MAEPDAGSPVADRRGADPDDGHGSSAELAALRADLARRHLVTSAADVLSARLGLNPGDAVGQLERLAASTGQTPSEFAADLLGEAPHAAPPGDDSRAPTEARGSRLAATAVAAADDLTALAQALLQEGLAPLGAGGLLLWHQHATGCLELVGRAGVTALEAAYWRWLPPQWSTLLQQAALDGSARWLPDGVTSGEPLPGPAADAARAVLPLRRHGRRVGLALVLWPGPAELAEPLRRRVEELVGVVARVLDTHTAVAPEPADQAVLSTLMDLLAHPAMSLRRDPRSGRSHVEHLNAAARRVAVGLPEPTGRALAELIPFASDDLADLISRAHACGSPQRAARLPATHRAGGPGPLVDVRVLPIGGERTVLLWHTGSSDHGFSVMELAARLTDLAAFEYDLTQGTSRWSERAYTTFGRSPAAEPLPLEELAGRLHHDDRNELSHLISTLTERQESASATLRLLRDDGGLRHIRVVAEPVLTHGTLTGVTGVFQDVSAQHHTEVALTATFDRLTSVQRQAALRHQLALQLQEIIVPEIPEPQRLPGLQVTARYRPAAAEYRVGGDWYEVLPLPTGRILVAVGDVAGHGIDSANGMVALRNAMRGLALAEFEPAKLMEYLNRVALHTQGRPTATAICALYDPASRRLCWASAGHLPPLLLRDGRARLLERAHNVLLGAVPDATYQEISTELRVGDTLILYTDGLIERRHSGLDETLATLRRAAERPVTGEIDEQADHLLAEATGDTDDDTSLILLRIC